MEGFVYHVFHCCSLPVIWSSKKRSVVKVLASYILRWFHVENGSWPGSLGLPTYRLNSWENFLRKTASEQWAIEENNCCTSFILLQKDRKKKTCNTSDQSISWKLNSRAVWNRFKLINLFKLSLSVYIYHFHYTQKK